LNGWSNNMHVDSNLPRVHLFSLGGTIASINDGSSVRRGAVPKLTGEQLVAVVPRLGGTAQIESTSFRQCASGDLTIEDMVELAHAIDDILHQGAADVVVTQGTDTLEETSFALSLLVTSSRAVVVTGAMRNPTLPGADGPANLWAAVEAAVRLPATGLGCVVVFNDEIHDPRFIRKTHTSSVATFRSAVAGPIGWISEGTPRLVRIGPVQERVKIPAGSAIPKVALLTAALGEDAQILDVLPALGYAGLVFEAFGGGHSPSRIVGALERLARSMPVVLASRTGSGEILTHTYDHPGSEQDLLSRGLISAGILDGPKARVLLSLLLAGHTETSTLAATFKRISLPHN
jgi:L-asparaginase